MPHWKSMKRFKNHPAIRNCSEFGQVAVDFVAAVVLVFFWVGNLARMVLNFTNIATGFPIFQLKTARQLEIVLMKLRVRWTASERWELSF
jgi:hypothetical protein